MTLIGIDYGMKRVGIAVSDEGEEFAFPRAVYKNDGKLLIRVIELAYERKARGFVIGESKDYQGVENIIMEKAKGFASELEQKSNLEVYFEPEFMTSAEAQQVQGEGPMLDASAAALILKSYLEKNKK